MSRSARAPSRFDELPSVEHVPRRPSPEWAELAALVAGIAAVAVGFLAYILLDHSVIAADTGLTFAVASHATAIFGLFTAVFAALRQSLSDAAGTRLATVFALATNAFVALAWIFVWVFLWSGS